LHLIPFFFALLVPSIAYALDLINVTPYDLPYCAIGVHPYSCDEFPTSPPCERGSRSNFQRINMLIAILIILFWVVCFLLLSFVSVKVTLSLMKLIKKPKNGQGSSDEDDFIGGGNDSFSIQRQRALIIQALAYMLSFLLTLLYPIFSSVGLPTNDTMIKMYYVLGPLQGFFNFLIFIGSKYHIYYLSKDIPSNLQVIAEIDQSTEFGRRISPMQKNDGGGLQLLSFGSITPGENTNDVMFSLESMHSKKTISFSCLADDLSFSSIQFAPEKKRTIKRVGMVNFNFRKRSTDSSKRSIQCNGSYDNRISQEVSEGLSKSVISGKLAQYGSEGNLDGFSIEEFNEGSTSNSSIILSTSSGKSGII